MDRTWRRLFSAVVLFEAMLLVPIEGEVLGSGSGSDNNDTNCDDCNVPFTPPFPLPFIPNPWQDCPCDSSVFVSFLALFPCTSTNILTSLKECDMLIFFGGLKARDDVNRHVAQPGICFPFLNIEKNTVRISHIIN